MASNSELMFSEQNNDAHDKDIDKILSSIEKDLLSETVQSQTAAMEALEIVLQKCERSVPTRILELVKKTSSKGLKVLVMKKLQVIITKAVKDTQVDYVELFSVDEANQVHVVQLYSEVFDILPPDVLKKFLGDVILPGMFNTNLDLAVRSILINMGFSLIEKCPISNLSNQEIKLYTVKAIEKYTKVLENLREQNYTRWHDLWIFLVRYSGKHLHVAMDLANKLLRVVEYAFRNPSYEQRLKGYDCWKELIDNASLDMKHMCSNKQVKLLVTPLRAKFSKMEVVICKRFEVFLYLLEKLQNQAVLCLNEFIEFCFGISNNMTNSSKNGRGKLVPSLWLKSIQVFLAILGDQTYISNTLNRSLFNGPIINETNIDNFDQVVICSVIESSILLKHISLDVQEKTTIMSSLWEALFNILMKSSQEIQEKCFQTIFGSLSTIFKEFNEDLTYIGLFAAFTQLNDSSIDYRLISDSLKLLLEYALKFLCEKSVSDEFYRQFHELVQICCIEDHIIEFLIEQLKKIEVSKNELKIFELWTYLGKKIIEDIENHNKIVAPYFLWPVNQLQHFKEGVAKDVCSKWSDMLARISKKSKNCIVNTMIELEKTLKTNPLLSSNIAMLISPLEQEKIQFDDENVKAILKLMSNILSLPLISQNSAEKLNGLVIKCMQVLADIEITEIDTETADNICQCVEKISNQKKGRTFNNMLDKIAKKTSTSNVKTESRLRKLMLDSSTTTDKEIKTPSNNAKTTTQGQSPGSLSRSVKMTRMAVSKPGVDPDQDKVNALQLFGKNINTMTPLKVKGSMLKSPTVSSPSSRCKKMVNSIRKQHIPEPPTIEDQNCDFVLIDTEVKLQKDKLTEHQKEELRRRREDIPAMYQDLSQSQTHSQSSSSKDTMNIQDKPEVNEEKDNDKNNCSTSDTPPEGDVNKSVEEIKVDTPHRYFDALKKLDGNDSNSDSNDSTSKATKKNYRYMKELNRIKMDIVGADTIFNDLPSKRQRKPVEKVQSVIREKKIIKGKNIEDNEQQNDLKECTNIEASIKEIKNDPILDESKDNIVVEVVEQRIEQLEAASDPKETTEVIASTSSVAPSKLIVSRRKSVTPKKFMKSPTSEKKKPGDAATPRKSKSRESAKRTKLIIDKSSQNMEVTPLISADPQQSEIMFPSELDDMKEKSKRSKKVKVEKVAKIIKTNTPVKYEPLMSVFDFNETDGPSTQENVEKINSQSINIDGKKKRPKEIMKKNKEKVRTIQSQLKLANLGNLSNSAEPKKTKNAKLIFIREITNPNNKESKVSAAGLKRNRDDKSKNIAYTIESPAVSIDLASLNLNIKPLEENDKLSQSMDNILSVRKPDGQGKKRKRANSEASSNASSSDVSPGVSTSPKENVRVKKKYPKKSSLVSNQNDEDEGEKTKSQKTANKGSSEVSTSHAGPVASPRRKQTLSNSPTETSENKNGFDQLTENKFDSNEEMREGKTNLLEITDIKPLASTPAKQVKTRERKRRSAVAQVAKSSIIEPDGNCSEQQSKSNEEPYSGEMDGIEVTDIKASEVSPETRTKLKDRKKRISLSNSVKSAMSVPVMERTHPTEGTRVHEINQIIVENIEFSETSPDKMVKTREKKVSQSPKKNVEISEDVSCESPKMKGNKINLSRKSLPKTSPTSSPTRVTRSRSWSLSPMTLSEKAANPEPLKAVKSLFSESEDVIESSQDSSMSTSIVNNKRKLQTSISNVSPKIKIKEDFVSKELPDNDNSVPDEMKSKEKPISQADTETCESNYEPCEIRIDVDLPEKPELTDSERLLSITETVSIVSQVSDDNVKDDKVHVTGNEELGNTQQNMELSEEPFNHFNGEERASSPITNPIEVEFIGTPEKKTPDDLPGSPVSNATPTLTRELLDNTLDISPINPQEQTEEKPEDFPTNSGEVSENIMETEEVPSRIITDNKSLKSQVTLNLRSNKLLNMVNVESPISHRGIGKRVISSPACTKTRYEKLFSFFNENKVEGEKLDGKNDLSNYTGNADDILTFTREVPSPLAIPSSSILKRKLADTEEGYSPCPKRKRVNFSYPCISSTKLYIRHKEELGPHKASNPKNLFDEEFDEEDSEDEDPFADPPEYVGTEESMDITNSLLLCRKKPIYEQLIDCQESLDVLWKRLSSPVYSEVLKKLLKGKNILTIGDLARLNETEISRLPFKQPRLKTVRKALNFYFTNNLKNSSRLVNSEENNGNSLEDQQKRFEEVEGVPSDSVSEESSLCKVATVKDKLIDVLLKIREEKIPLDKFGDTFLDFVDETQVINLLRYVYNTDFRQFFDKSHWRYLVESIVQLGGTTELFDIISDLAENNDVFAEQLENIVQLRIEQNPLKNIIKKRSLVDLQVALNGCITEGIFVGKDVVQTCLMPLVKSPSDIENYFMSLTIVQVNDLFIKRVDSADLTIFLDQIREHYGNYTVAQCVKRDDVLKICSKEELISTLSEKDNEVDTIKELVSRVSDKNRLVELFNYIGSLIPLKNVIESHIEFLKRIPLNEDSEK